MVYMVLVDQCDEKIEVQQVSHRLKRFRNYCGPTKVARSGFPLEKTTKGDVASLDTNCETRLGQVIFSEILHFIRSDDLSGFRYYQKTATSPLQARGFDVCRLRHLLDTAQEFTDGRSQR